MKYIVEYDAYWDEPRKVEVEAETVSKAKYTAYKKLIEDNVLSKNAPFIGFLRYIICRVWTEDGYRAWH